MPRFSSNPLVLIARNEVSNLPSWMLTWSPAILWLARAHNRNTRQAYATPVKGLMRVARVELAAVAELHVLAYNTAMVDRDLSVRTIRHHLVILSSFFDWAIPNGHHPGPNPAAGIPLPSISKSIAGIALDQGQLDRLIAAARGPRDRALLQILSAGGLRAFEAISLQERDVHVDGSLVTIHVRQGKGGRPRTMDIHAPASADVAAWAVARSANGPTSPFLHHTRRGPRAGCALGYTAVYHIVTAAARRAGLGHVAPHDLRRTFVTLALDLGRPLPAVQHEAGHGRMEQTIRYYREKGGK